MLFLDDFLEMLEELPGELRERCTDIREIDLEIAAACERNRRAIREFFERGAHMTSEQRAARLKELQADFARLRTRSEEKIALAERMQELLEKYTQHLEKEKTHFKYELEADNPGVTEGIEKRFSAYVEQMLAMRRERRKRNHTQTSSASSATTSSGAANGGNEENGHRGAAGGPSASASGGAASASSRHASFSATATTPTAASSSSSSKMMRLDAFVLDEPTASFVPPPTASPAAASASPSTSGSGYRSRKQSAVDEGVKEARRDAIRQQLQASLQLRTASPVPSGDRWHSSASPASSTHHSGYNFPPTPGSTAAASTPSPVSAAMPNFTGLESRHGRPRKLTSRVQEMFNSPHSLVGHRERAARAAQPHASYVHIEAPIPGDDDGEGEEDTGDERTWCFCNEKSYGGMVACDNKECPYEWFHMPCVGLEVPPRGKWFCPYCAEARARRGEAAAAGAEL